MEPARVKPVLSELALRQAQGEQSKGLAFHQGRPERDALVGRRRLRLLRNSQLRATYAIGFCVLFTNVAMFTYVTFHLGGAAVQSEHGRARVVVRRAT